MPGARCEVEDEGESGEKYGELDVGDSGLVSSPFSHGARAKSTLRAHGLARDLIVLHASRCS